MDKINGYINQLSMFVTARSSDLSHFHKVRSTKKMDDQNEEDP